jgi:intermediate cleaving peptidase 55
MLASQRQVLGPQKTFMKPYSGFSEAALPSAENANLSLDKLHSIAEDGLREQLKQLGFDVSGTV